MALDNAHTPSPNSVCAASDKPTPQQWAADLLDLVDQMVADGEIEPFNAAVLRGKAAFGARRDAIAVLGTTIDLWGYGTVPVAFQSARRGGWVRLTDLVEPTGLSYQDLLEEFCTAVASCEDGEQPDVDLLTWERPGGGTAEIPLAHTNFIMLVMAGRSPWADEFNKAFLDVYRHAAKATGLAKLLGLGGALEVPQVSREQARQAAFRGPAGAL